MIHILQSVSNMDRGGIETVLMNVYRHLDRSRFQFDFLVNKPKPGFYDEEIRALGGRIFVSPGLSPAKYPAYIRFVAQLLNDEPQIQVLHAHNEAMAYYALRGAQKAGLPVRIAHAHNTRLPRDYKLPLKLACKALIPSAATDYWACGRDAGLYYFGQKRWEREGVIMRNAVDLRRFGFQADKRAALRAQYGLQERLVIGSVARFMPQKNHQRMLQIFARLQAIQPQSSLALIGEGPLMESCRQQARQLGIASDVLFLGALGDPSGWYQAMDALLMPSLYEGLPTVGIEAQAAGLPCLLSDTITDEAALIPVTRRISLEQPDDVWARSILQCIQAEWDRNQGRQAVKEGGYDIVTETRLLESRYQALIEKRRTAHDA